MYRYFAITLLLFATAGQAYAQEQPIRVGAEQTERYFPLLAGKQIGLVVNHSSLVGSRHLVDTLAAAGFCITRIFAPEHGYRGDAPDGQYLIDGIDSVSGAPIVSLYGRKRRPSADDMASVDLIIFDIQDVGTRFYTYITTLFFILETCGEYGVPVMVLDRPNPNGHYVDGPVLDMRLRSFVGIAPLPVVHGCTVGELARLFIGEYWTGPKRPELTVIGCQNYHHKRPYELPVPPSPNLPNQLAVLLYPSLCFFEGTAVSIGRGTDWPFQLAGHPSFPDTSGFSFTPWPNAASRYPPLEGRRCWGYDFRSLSIDSLYRQARIDLNPLLDFYCEFAAKDSFFLPSRYIERLSGTYSLWPQIVQGNFESDIKATWEADLEAFRAIRKKYLLYPDD